MSALERRVVGGTIVRPEGSAPGDLLIRDGVIVAVGQVDRAGAEIVDASGCLVLPGGVDVHTHVFGAVAADTRSALCGGTTTALAFVDAEPGERPSRRPGGRSPTSCPRRSSTSPCTR